MAMSAVFLLTKVRFLWHLRFTIASCAFSRDTPSTLLIFMEASSSMCFAMKFTPDPGDLTRSIPYGRADVDILLERKTIFVSQAAYGLLCQRISESLDRISAVTKIVLSWCEPFLFRLVHDEYPLLHTGESFLRREILLVPGSTWRIWRPKKYPGPGSTTAHI